MKYEVRYDKEALKFIKAHPEIRKKFLSTFRDISANYPENAKKYDIKRLASNKDLFRLRIGKYRAIYTIFNNEVFILVLNIDSRGDIYKSI